MLRTRPEVNFLSPRSLSSSCCFSVGQNQAPNLSDAAAARRTGLLLRRRPLFLRTLWPAERAPDHSQSSGRSPTLPSALPRLLSLPCRRPRVLPAFCYSTRRRRPLLCSYFIPAKVLSKYYIFGLSFFIFTFQSFFYLSCLVLIKYYAKLHDLFMVFNICK